MSLAAFIPRPGREHTFEFIVKPEIIWTIPRQAWAVSQGFFVELSNNMNRANIRTWLYSKFFEATRGSKANPTYNDLLQEIVTRSHDTSLDDWDNYLTLRRFIKQQDRYACGNAWHPQVARYATPLKWYRVYRAEAENDIHLKALLRAENEKIETKARARKAKADALRMAQNEQAIAKLNDGSDESRAVLAGLARIGIDSPDELKAQLARQATEEAAEARHLKGRTTLPEWRREAVLKAQRRRQVASYRDVMQKRRDAMDRARAIGEEYERRTTQERVSSRTAGGLIATCSSEARENAPAGVNVNAERAR